MEARRFPPPWTVEDHLACFIVKDSTGQALAHIYYEDAGQQEAAKLLTKDEARRIGVNFARRATEVATALALGLAKLGQEPSMPHPGALS